MSALILHGFYGSAQSIHALWTQRVIKRLKGPQPSSGKKYGGLIYYHLTLDSRLADFSGMFKHFD